MTLYNNKTNGKLCVRKKDTMMWLFLVMLTLPHMKPPFLDRIPAWEMLFNGWRLVSFTVVVFWVLVVKRKISMIVIFISVWEVFLFITTALHQGEIYNSAVSAFSVLSIAFLYDVAHDKEETFLSSQLFCFEIVIYANLISELLYPDGLYSEGTYLFTHYKNWFLGYYNNHTKYFIPAIMFALLYAEKKKSYLRITFLISTIFVSALLIWSGGVLTSLFIMLIVYTFFKNITRIFNYFSYWLLHILFFLAVYVFRLQELLRWLVDSILGKWNSLTTRINVWKDTANLIARSPFFGYGIQSQFRRAAEVHYNHGIHAHNMLFEILYQGGGGGLCLWIIIVVVAGMRLYKYRNTGESKIIATAFLGWCVATLVEPFTSCFLIGMFVIAYYSNSVLGSAEDQIERRTIKKTRSATRELSGS